MKRLIQMLAVLLALLLTACASNIKAPKGQNLAPTEKFSNFSQFELAPVTLAAAFANNETNQRVQTKIQEYVDARIKPTLMSWNEKSSNNGRVLLIQPHISEVRFIGVGARIGLGPLAGRSGIIFQMTYIDKATGKVIATPQFFQQAGAMSGAFSMGGQDNAMLARVVTLASSYNTNNYNIATGGDSGANDKPIEATPAK